MEAALASVKTNSSPGIDSLGYRIIKLLPASLQRTLLDINRLFESASFPPWNHSLVFLIPKSDNKSLRPITSCVLKLTERMLLYRLQWLL